MALTSGTRLGPYAIVSPIGAGRLGEPRLLYEYAAAIPSGLNIPSYNVAPDGQRSLAIQESDEELRRTEIHVVLNWREELERLVPSDP